MWNINQCLVQGFISNVQSSWDSSCAIAAIRWHATAADLLGWNSGAWACRVMPLSSTGRSQDSSGGYKCCTIALSCAPLTMPSLPWISCLTIPNLHLPWSPSSPLIRTTSPGFTVTSPVLWLRLWLSLTVRFTKLFTNSFRSSFQIPEVHYELGNFITQLSIKSRTWKRRDEFNVTVRRFASYELLLMRVGNWTA